jgi:ribonuclease HI
VNIDGSFTENPRYGGWGFVIRDVAGTVVGSGAGQLLFPQSVIHTDAEACLQALAASMNWGMTRIMIESDY